MPSPSEPPQRLDIRKYPNRRYYDATRSRHLTLEDIRTLIREGYEVRVTDSKTSADITAQVLTQLILELETPKLDLFPIPLLIRLIRLNDEFMKEFFGGALLSLLEQQHDVQQRVRQAEGLSSAFPWFSAWSKALFAPFANSPQPTAAASSNNQHASDLSESIEKLEQQLAELKTRLPKEPPRKTRRRQLGRSKS